MLFCLFGILVTHLMGALAAPRDTMHRDYANKISMVCSYDKTIDGFLSMELGENDRIGDRLKLFGRGRKVIYYIVGYADDINPADGGVTLAGHISGTKKWNVDNNTVVCKFDFVDSKDEVVCCVLPDYRKQVRKRIPFAANIIKNVAAEMYTKVFDSFENFQLIGFSLGCHVAGYTAKLIKSELKMTVSRIFALDPAKTIVANNRKNELEKTDANYVQAIITSTFSQTNIDVHCKVFINDGHTQPMCEKSLPIVRTFCNHIYAARLYDEIGMGRKVIAYQKSNENDKCAMTVGHFSQENAIGVFYADTISTKQEKIPGTSNRHKSIA